MTDRMPDALAGAGARLERALDAEWPAGVDLVVLSEVACYLEATTLRHVLDRECARLAEGATVVAATATLNRVAAYRDDDVVISVFGKGAATSVAARTGVPGAVSSESTSGEGGVCC